MAKGMRIDVALVTRGLFPSRQQAQTAIMAGEVQIDGRRASKASDSVNDDNLLIVAARARYVGRGGTKLEGALCHFHLACTRLTARDIRASTGGRTGRLPTRGARPAPAGGGGAEAGERGGEPGTARLDRRHCAQAWDWYGSALWLASPVPDQLRRQGGRLCPR